MKNPFSKMKSKEFWKKDVKEITLSDILIWIAIILMFVVSWNNIQAGRDPCSYCIVQNTDRGDVTCKEYFNQEINLSWIGDNEDFKSDDFRETP